MSALHPYGLQNYRLHSRGRDCFWQILLLERYICIRWGFVNEAVALTLLRCAIWHQPQPDRSGHI